MRIKRSSGKGARKTNKRKRNPAAGGGSKQKRKRRRKPVPGSLRMARSRKRNRKKGKYKATRLTGRKRRRGRRRRLRRRKIAVCTPPAAPPPATIPGINLVGYNRAEMGLGEGCRLLARTMESAELPFGINNFQFGNPSRSEDYSWTHREQEHNPYRVNLIHVNGDQMPFVHQHFGEGFFHDRYNIGYWAWELQEFPDWWLDGFAGLQEIWTPSSFVRDALAQKSPVPVYTIPYGIQVDAVFDRNEQRNQLGLPPGRFLFLSMFDTHSTSERKNPRGAIEAFKRAFAPGRTDVGLVIKVHNTHAFPGEVDRLRAELDGYSNIYILERTLTRMEVYGLIDACDAFVSLHRSEGFGLVMAEAMCMGKPVIGTLWSGNTEFMNEMNCCAVRNTLVTIQADAGPYRANCTWAEPDLYHAASYMARLVQDSEYYRLIAGQGQASIRGSLSPQAAGLRIRQRLTELGII